MWEAKGYLTKQREGKVWAEASRSKPAALRSRPVLSGCEGWPATRGNRQPGGNPGCRGGVAAPEITRDEDGAPALADPETIRTLDLFIETLLGGSYADQMTADTVSKANALALKHVIAARRDGPGKWSRWRSPRRSCSRRHRSARDAWPELSEPERAPCSLRRWGVEAEKLIEALTAHVHRQLEDIGEPDADFAAAQAGDA